MIQVEGLTDRVAVVTGAGRGIGQAIAEVLAGNGAKVAALDLEAPGHPGILGVACDVSDEAAVEAAFTQVERDLGPVSVLVLNAGIFPIVPFEETTRELWDRTLAINLTGAFLCARRALPAMREAGYGRIVGIGSSAGKAGGARSVAAYAASKAGVMTLDEVDRQRVRQVRHHRQRPRAGAHRHPDDRRHPRPRQHGSPSGGSGSAEEVAALVAFLASEHAGYITGEVTDINGGFLID